MKLEFLKNINEYREHAIRLSDFNSFQATKFREVVDRFIEDDSVSVDLSSVDFIESVNCRFTLQISSEDLGISSSDGVNFVCDLTLSSYKNMSALLEPFCRKESKGYQWLYDIDIPIGFLFSAGKDIPVEE